MFFAGKRVTINRVYTQPVITFANSNKPKKTPLEEMQETLVEGLHLEIIEPAEVYIITLDLSKFDYNAIRNTLELQNNSDYLSEEEGIKRLENGQIHQLKYQSEYGVIHLNKAIKKLPNKGLIEKQTDSVICISREKQELKSDEDGNVYIDGDLYLGGEYTIQRR